MRRHMNEMRPWNEFDQFERVFARMMGVNPRDEANGNTSHFLAIDVSEHNHTLEIRAAVPGIDPKSLDIEVEGNVLTIKGSTSQESEQEGRKYYRREVRFGSFTRSVRLPEDIDTSNVQAEFKHGILIVTIPRIQPEQPTPLKVAVRNLEAPATNEEVVAEG